MSERFQLQERLNRARVAHPSDSIGESVNDVFELADVDSDEEFEQDSFIRRLLIRHLILLSRGRTVAVCNLVGSEHTMNK